MRVHEAPITEEEILAALRKGRALPANESARLEPCPAGRGRRDSIRRFSFRVWRSGTTAFHLTAGPSLKSLHARGSAFAKANPEIACKPLFFLKTRSFDLAGREFFEGMNLEEALDEKRIDNAGWQEAVRSIASRLAATSRPSSTRRLLSELADVEKSLLSMEWLSPFDARFLREVIFPVVRDGAARAPARTAWTNGDFIAKNILFDGAGAFRLIDYEFARQTHFPELDWFRLQRHSRVPPGTDLAALSGIPYWPPWLEMLGWLEQALRLGEIGESAATEDGFERIAVELTGLLGSETPLTKGSVFARALGRAERQRHITRLALEAHITRLDARIAEFEREKAAIVKPSPPVDPSEAAVRIRYLEDALARLRAKHDQLLESLQAQNDLIRDFESRGRSAPASSP